MRELRIQRMNADASALLTIDGTHILVDPWLVGSEIDGSVLFNEAWHVEPVVSVDEVKRMPISLILISLPFADHLHEETLAQLNPELRIVANQETAALLRKKPCFATREILEVPQFPEFLKVDTLSFSFLAPSSMLDFTHGGMIIRAQVTKRRQDHCLWAPHGIKFRDHPSREREQLKDLNWVLIAATLSKYGLPGILGGTVNLGLDEGLDLIKNLKPRFVIDIHSEQKASRGLVPLVAKTEYPTVEEKRDSLGKIYVPCEGLEPVTLL